MNNFFGLRGSVYPNLRFMEPTSFGCCPLTLSDLRGVEPTPQRFSSITFDRDKILILFGLGEGQNRPHEGFC